MAKHILIEPAFPHERRTVDLFYDLAAELTAEGEEVTLFLIGDGADPLRGGPYRDRLRFLAEIGIDVRIDETALKNLGIESSDLPEGVSKANLEDLARLLLNGGRAVWHSREG